MSMGRKSLTSHDSKETFWLQYITERLPGFTASISRCYLQDVNVRELLTNGVFVRLLEAHKNTEHFDLSILKWVSIIRTYAMKTPFNDECVMFKKSPQAFSSVASRGMFTRMPQLRDVLVRARETPELRVGKRERAYVRWPKEKLLECKPV